MQWHEALGWASPVVQAMPVRLWPGVLRDESALWAVRGAVAGFCVPGCVHRLVAAPWSCMTLCCTSGPVVPAIPWRDHGTGDTGEHQHHDRADPAGSFLPGHREDCWLVQSHRSGPVRAGRRPTSIRAGNVRARQTHLLTLSLRPEQVQAPPVPDNRPVRRHGDDSRGVRRLPACGPTAHALPWCVCLVRRPTSAAGGTHPTSTVTARCEVHWLHVSAVPVPEHGRVR